MQKKLFTEVWPSLKFDLPTAGTLTPAQLFDPVAEKIVLEIGYGGGEHLAQRATDEPATGFIGCEVFNTSIGKLLEKVAARKLTNIRLYDDDALKLLQKLPDAVLDQVILFYPDPWPKVRHHKRRFVSFLTLFELARVIRPGGSFRVATDIEDYANWVLAHILREPKLRWEVGAPGSWHLPFTGWVETRYEQKARREGRAKSFYFEFIRVVT